MRTFFQQIEDGRYLLTAEQIGDLQASEFNVGYDSCNRRDECQSDRDKFEAMLDGFGIKGLTSQADAAGGVCVMLMAGLGKVGGCSGLFAEFGFDFQGNFIGADVMPPLDIE